MTLAKWPPQEPQRQDSLAEQLKDLHILAARYGMYDAADWLWKVAFEDPAMMEYPERGRV